MDQYTIQVIGYNQFSDLDWEYYTGDQYIHQHEYYAVSDRDKKKAKPYTSKKRAENASKKILEKCCNVIEVRVKPV